MIGTILLVFSFVLLTLVAFWNPGPPRVQLGWAGLACWCLSILLNGLHVG